MKPFQGDAKYVYNSWKCEHLRQGGITKLCDEIELENLYKKKLQPSPPALLLQKQCS